MKTNFMKFALTLAVFCVVGLSSCGKDDGDCEPCYTVSALGFGGDKVCESDLDSPEAFQDSLTQYKAAADLSLGLLTVEESEECN